MFGKIAEPSCTQAPALEAPNHALNDMVHIEHAQLQQTSFK